MRIDPESTLGGYPVLQVRNLVRKAEQPVVLGFENRSGRILRGATGSDWSGERAGSIRSRETPARRRPKNLDDHPAGAIVRLRHCRQADHAETAETALARLLERVERMNRDNHFLAKVMRVVVFGSYLRGDVHRLGDVDVAVELEPKEADRQRLRELNYRRVAESERKGRRFSRTLDRETWWQLETFHFLKGRSRSISLHDYRAERQLVDEVPHRILMSSGAKRGQRSAEKSPKLVPKARRPRDCPF